MFNNFELIPISMVKLQLYTTITTNLGGFV